MLGGMLSGHDQSEMEVVEDKDGRKRVQFYGMSSDTAMKKYAGGVAEYRASEGKTVSVPYRGDVAETVRSILGGLRSACLQVIATWTVAAWLPLGGLGRFLFDAIPVRDYGRMLAGSILVIVLALVADGLLVLLQRAATPAGVRAASARPALASPAMTTP